MKLHNLISLLLLSFLAFSCQDVIELDVPDGDRQLVVDGWLTDQEGEKTVRLSFTSNYFSNAELPKVQGALVVLFQDNQAVDTLEEERAGLYITDHIGQVGATYYLSIETSAGERYASQPELLKPISGIDSIYYQFQEETIFEEEGYYVMINTSEPPGIGDYYRWKRYINGEYLNTPEGLLFAEDEFVDGNPILGFEVTFEPLEAGDHFRIEQFSISERAFDFLTRLEEQTAFIGSLFDPPPAALPGNVINLNPDGEPALGFFGVSAVSSAEVVIGE